MKTLRYFFIEGKYKKITGIIIWKCLIDYMFADVVTDVFSYMNQVADYNYVKLLISWILVFAFYVLEKQICDGMLKFSYDFMYILSLIPTLTVWWVKNENNSCFVLILLYWLIWGMASIIVSHSSLYRQSKILRVFDNNIAPNVSADREEIINKGAILLTFIVCIICTLFFSYYYGGMRVFINLGDVYKYRNADGNSMSSIETYLYNWMVSIVLPLLLLYYTTSKKYLSMLICCLLISMNYSIYGNKTMLFMILLTFCISLVNRIDFSKYLIIFFLAGANAITLLSCISYKCIAGFTLWGVALIDRMTTGIAAAHFYYYDFFQTNKLLFLRQSILRFISTNPYDKPVSVIIGSSIKYNPTGNYNNLNNGVFSDAYANFGTVGVLIYPILFVVAIGFFEILLKGIKDSYKYLILCWLLLYCMSTGFFQWLLSGGFIIAIVLLRLYKKYRIKV